MTAGRTNHTLFASAPRKAQHTPLKEPRDLGRLLDPEYARDLLAATPQQRRRWLEGEWLEGDKELR